MPSFVASEAPAAHLDLLTRADVLHREAHPGVVPSSPVIEWCGAVLANRPKSIRWLEPIYRCPRWLQAGDRGTCALALQGEPTRGTVHLSPGLGDRALAAPSLTLVSQIAPLSPRGETHKGHLRWTSSRRDRPVRPTPTDSYRGQQLPAAAAVEHHSLIHDKARQDRQKQRPAEESRATERQQPLQHGET
jgi:hypothetical protein